MNFGYEKLRETTVEKLNAWLIETESKRFTKDSIKLLELDKDYSETDAVRFLRFLRTRYWLRDRRLGYGIHTATYGDWVEAKVPTFRVGGRVVYPGFLIADLLINKGEFPAWLRRHYHEITFSERGGSFVVVVPGTATATPQAAE